MNTLPSPFPPSDAPYVLAQLGQTLDGRIATISGESRWINGACALDHLHGLRAAADAVVVGVGTVIADDPQLTVRRVAGRMKVEASGGVNLDTVKAIAETGVDLISVGALTHSASVLDLGLDIEIG